MLATGMVVLLRIVRVPLAVRIFVVVRFILTIARCSPVVWAAARVTYLVVVLVFPQVTLIFLMEWISPEVVLIFLAAWQSWTTRMSMTPSHQGLSPLRVRGGTSPPKTGRRCLSP